jgi:hypothetical protein
MKKSGVFWLMVLAGILYFAYSLGWFYLVVAYVLWHIIGTITHYSFKSINIMNYNDDFVSDEIKELFLEAPYLFTMVHLLIIGIISGFYFGVINTGSYIRNFNQKLDNFEVKLPKKEKKKSFSEYSKEI